MQKRISIFLKTAIYIALFSTEKLNFQLSTQTETMNIWLFRVKSSSLINVFFYLSVHKLFALLFNFRTSCKLQPKYNNVWCCLCRGFKYRLFLWQATALTAAPALFPQSSYKYMYTNVHMQTTKSPSIGLGKLGNLLTLKWSEPLHRA